MAYLEGRLVDEQFLRCQPLSQEQRTQSGHSFRSDIYPFLWPCLLKSVGWLVVLLSYLLFSWRTLADDMDLQAFLSEGSGLAPEATTSAILDGTFELERASIENDTPFRIHFSVPGASDLEGVSHYLAGSVSEYTICLLQVREQSSTLGVLEKVSPKLLLDLDAEFCGPCCGGLVELQRPVLDTLQRYWIARLGLE